MLVTQLNHVALRVSDTAKSSRFFADVLGLAPIARPAFDFPGAWFRIGADQELHLIEGPADANGQASRGNHFAMMVDSIDAAAERLRARGLPFRGPNPRPDGAMQIFLEDPDGHVIELCTPPGQNK